MTRQPTFTFSGQLPQYSFDLLQPAAQVSALQIDSQSSPADAYVLGVGQLSHDSIHSQQAIQQRMLPLDRRSSPAGAYMPKPMDSDSARNMILGRLPTEILELILLPELSGRTIGPHESPLVGQDPNFRNFWKTTWKRRLVCRRFNEAIFPVLLQKLGRQGLGLLLRTIVIDGNCHHMGWDAICKATYQQHLRMTELLSRWRLDHAQRVSFLCNMYFAISDPRDDRFIPAREIWGKTDEEVEELVLGAFDEWCNRFRVRINQSGKEMVRHREELERAGGNSQLIKEENATHERAIYWIDKEIISLGPDAWFLDAQLAKCNHFWHQENPLCCEVWLAKREEQAMAVESIAESMGRHPSSDEGFRYPYNSYGFSDSYSLIALDLSSQGGF